MKKIRYDMLVLGFALFSMFFGAGNVIFPPYLGMGAGKDWVLAFVCYYLADIGLALLAIFALLKCDGNVERITGLVGKIPGILMMSAIILCVGPLLAIPRTAATTFEMAVAPLTGGKGMIITSIAFFAIILLLTIKESAVVDIVGKFLTPVLFIGLLALIIKGIYTPIGPISQYPKLDNVIVSGISSGYQTMDVLGALAFGIIIVKSAVQKGYESSKDKFRIIVSSSLVAAVGLLVVYCGLAYLGATSSTMYNLDINQAQLVVSIIQQLMGQTGTVILGVVVALACITTAIALVSAAAEYFSKLSGRRISYQALIIIICIFSTVVSNIGLSQIIAFASPILNFVYPGALTLIVLSFFSQQITNRNVYRFATFGAMAVSLLQILNGWGLPLNFITYLPLEEFGFAWVIPAIVCGIIGWMVKAGGALEREGQEAPET